MIKRIGKILSSIIYKISPFFSKILSRFENVISVVIFKEKVKIVFIVEINNEKK